MTGVRWGLASVLIALATASCGGGSTSAGAELAADVGCTSCHSDEDSRLAPTWHGLFGSTVSLEDGSSVTVDEAYLKRSIVDPDAQVVEGYRPTMPVFPLTDDEVDLLVDHIAGLGE